MIASQVGEREADAEGETGVGPPSPTKYWRSFGRRPRTIVTKALDGEEFRRLGHRMVDFIADYYDDIETFPVQSQVQPGYLKKVLPENASKQQELLEDILNELWTLNVTILALSNLTNFDCSTLWVKDRTLLVAAISTNPEFLRHKLSAENLVVDFKDWQIPLGRRIRVLKLWMVMRMYGTDFLQSYIRNHCDLAKDFEMLVRADHRFEPADSDGDYGRTLTGNLVEALNNGGDILVTHTVCTPLGLPSVELGRRGDMSMLPGLSSRSIPRGFSNPTRGQLQRL